MNTDTRVVHNRTREVLFIGAIVVLMVAGSAFASEAVEKVIYSLQDGQDGALPQGRLVADQAGNLYGTTLYGGDIQSCGGSGCGTVFELSPPATPGRVRRHAL